jgi:hypothetical protein
MNTSTVAYHQTRPFTSASIQDLKDHIGTTSRRSTGTKVRLDAGWLFPASVPAGDRCAGNFLEAAFLTGGKPDKFEALHARLIDDKEYGIVGKTFSTLFKPVRSSLLYHFANTSRAENFVGMSIRCEEHLDLWKKELLLFSLKVNEDANTSMHPQKPPSLSSTRYRCLGPRFYDTDCLASVTSSNSETGVSLPPQRGKVRIPRCCYSITPTMLYMWSMLLTSAAASDVTKADSMGHSNEHTGRVLMWIAGVLLVGLIVLILGVCGVLGTKVSHQIRQLPAPTMIFASLAFLFLRGGDSFEARAAWM